MKKFWLLAIAVGLFSMLQAQVKTASREDMVRFMKSKTCFVLEEDPFSAYNAFVKEELSQIWKITPFEIITMEEFEKRCADPNTSFVLMAEALFDETRSSLFRSNSDILANSDPYKFNILTLVMGDKSKNINHMPDLATVPVSYSEVEDEESYEYKIGVLIYFMQYYVNYCITNPGKDIRDLVKETSGKIKNYELWLRKEELAPEVNTVEKIKAWYPFPVKIATAEEIAKAIKEKNPKVALLHKVGPEGTTKGSSKCWKFIITAAEGIPLYFSSHRISDKKPDAFLTEDFKNLNN